MPPIPPLGAPGPTATSPAGRVEPASGFRVPEAATDLPAAAERPVAIGTTGGLAALLATQELADPQLRDRAARRHAAVTLDTLARLQAALLGGDADAQAAGEALGRLAALAAQPAPADPGLAAITRAVAVRARVELARRTSE